jgi:type IV pilus assembly protein PilW
MSRDIRMAGYSGCINYDQADDKADMNFWVFYQRAVANNALFGLLGEEWSDSDYGSTGLNPMVDGAMKPIGTDGGKWSNSLGQSIANAYPEAIANSDILQTWTTAEIAVDVDNWSTDGTQLQLNVAKGHGVTPGNVIMFSSCGTTFIVQICATTDTRLTASAGGSITCDNNFDLDDGRELADLQPDNANVSTIQNTLEAFSFRDAVYFVGKRDNGDATPPALFRGVNGTAREMVEGVENMQILYGVDLNHDPGDLRTPDTYVTAANVGTRWSDVVAVRVTVLMRSFERITSIEDKFAFNYNGTSYTAEDGYVRQAYSTTIALRNRNVGEVPGLFSTSSP